MAFAVSTELTNGVAKITVSGELDAASANEFRAAIEQVASAQPKRVALLMDQLTFMASAGLRVLVFAKQRMGTGVDLYVVGAQAAVLETLEMTGFHYSVIMLTEYDATEIESL
jgi:anti-anti-sigma factor